MAFFGATIFFGITTALCVPYLYAYCTQVANVTVQESDVIQKEEESENGEDELMHSLIVKNGNKSLELKKTKIMKDASVNTIQSMESDTTSYKQLPSVVESSQGELNEVFHNARTETTSTSIHSNDSSSFRETRTRGPMQVQAMVHAQDVMPNSKTFVKETLDKRSFVRIAFENVNKNHLLKQKRQAFKKEKTSEKLKKFWTGLKSRNVSKPSSSEDSSQSLLSHQNFPLSLATSGSSSNKGIISNIETSLENSSSPTLKLQSQSPFGHSTLRDSKQKIALMYNHEVNGPPSIHIESPSGSNTSLTISVGDVSPIGILQLKSTTTVLIEIQERVASSDQDTVNSLPGRLRATGNELKENLRSSTF